RHPVWTGSPTRFDLLAELCPCGEHDGLPPSRPRVCYRRAAPGESPPPGCFAGGCPWTRNCGVPTRPKLTCSERGIAPAFPSCTATGGHSYRVCATRVAPDPPVAGQLCSCHAPAGARPL